MVEVVPEVEEKVSKDANLEDIGFDTFGMDTLRPLLEEKFSIRISRKEIELFSQMSVGDVINLAGKKLS